MKYAIVCLLVLMSIGCRSISNKGTYLESHKRPMKFTPRELLDSLSINEGIVYYAQVKNPGYEQISYVFFKTSADNQIWLLKTYFAENITYSIPSKYFPLLDSILNSGIPCLSNPNEYTLHDPEKTLAVLNKGVYSEVQIDMLTNKKCDYLTKIESILFQLESGHAGFSKIYR